MKHPEPGTVAIVAFTDGSEQLAFATKYAWTGANGRHYTIEQAIKVEQMTVVNPKKLDIDAILTTLEKVRGGLELLRPFFGARRFGKTTLSDTWTAVSDVIDSLGGGTKGSSVRTAVEEPKKFGAIVLVKLPTGKQKPLQRNGDGMWVNGTTLYHWYQIRDIVQDVVFPGHDVF